MLIWTDVDLLGSLSSHLLVFVFLLVTRDNVINAQQQDGRLKNRSSASSVVISIDDYRSVSGLCPHLNSSLVSLSFNGKRLPDSHGRHVGQSASFSIHTPTHTVVLSVFRLNTEMERERHTGRNS